MTIDLTTLHLDRGAHSSREVGVSVMEAVAWLAGERHTDHPHTASPVIAAFCRLINDRVGDEERQRLVAYVPRLVGTRAADEIELRRTMVIADWAVRSAAAAALRIAGLVELAENLSQLPPVTEGKSAREAARAAIATEETAMRAGEEAARAARATRSAAATERARRVAVVEEAARVASAEAAGSAASAEAAWAAASHTEAAVHAEAAAEAAVTAWAAAVQAAVQIPERPIDWTVPLERMLDVS